MSDSTNNLTAVSRGVLKRIKGSHGIINKVAIERGLLLYENHLTTGKLDFAKISKAKGAK